MAEVCPNCGLPKELCVCETIAKESEKIRVSVENRRFGKDVTVVENISAEMNPQEITKKLKQKFACGGTFKNGRIELQGDHLARAESVLVGMGFTKEQIEKGGRRRA
ncbi:MAG: translation initiation factor [Candidatus Aenigmarchaeota archaeon]|nr:translation initiation factor [Candidatus Aenigmarchaeota archaeon]